MKIAIGGMQKNEMNAAIKKYNANLETVITNDLDAAKLLKSGAVDYYFGACESGGGSAISVLIGLLGYSKCCTVCKNGKKPDANEIKKFVDDGKVCFGMVVSGIGETVPMLLEILEKK